MTAHKDMTAKRAYMSYESQFSKISSLYMCPMKKESEKARDLPHHYQISLDRALVFWFLISMQGKATSKTTRR